MSDEDQGPHADAVRHIPISIVPTRVLDLLNEAATVSTEQVVVNTNLPLQIRISLPVHSGTTILIYDNPSGGFLGQPSAVSPNVTIEGTNWPFTLRYTGTPPPETGSDVIVIQIPVAAGAPIGQNVHLIASRDGTTVNAAITLVFADRVALGDLNVINPPTQITPGPPEKPGKHDDDNDINVTIINIDLDSD